MGAKDLVVSVITSKVANEFVKKTHYSGKVVNNSQLHFGVFYNKILHGVMQFGCPLDKNKMHLYVKNTKWNGMLELNRMAFDDVLPKNSESRAISVAMRLIKKNAPHIEWIASFADATQCGDGTIYRASGFKLVKIKKNDRLLRFPDGTISHSLNYDVSRMTKHQRGLRTMFGNLTKGELLNKAGAVKVDGYQLLYILPLYKDVLERITVPILNFSDIEKNNAKMYKGVKNAS